MSTLVIAQTNNAGVQMSATVTDETTTDIVVTFVSSLDDAAGSIDKSFPATKDAAGSFELTDEDLTTLFGAVNLNSMKAGGESPGLSMSAQQFAGDAEVDVAQTTITGTTLNKMYYLQFALPLAPVKVSVSPSNSKLIIVATVVSKNAVSNQIKLTVHKTSADGLGEIKNSEVTGTAGDVSNGVNSFTFEATSLDNGSQYEIFAKFANTGADGNLQYGPKNAIAFQGEPNLNPGTVSSVKVHTALDVEGEFDSTNAATVNANWMKTDTDSEGVTPTSYTLLVSRADEDPSKVAVEVAQDAALAADKDTTVTLAPATIPRAMFIQGENQMAVKLRIKQYYQDGTSKLGNAVPGTVHKMIKPTVNTAVTLGDNDGDQTVRATTGSEGAGAYTLTSTFNGVDSTIAATPTEVTLNYDDINAPGNKTVEFTFAVVDANIGTATYSVTSSKVLYPFKSPVGPATPTITVARFNADPVIGFEMGTELNNGWSIASYTVVVEYVAPTGNETATYGSPYSETFEYDNMSASITATSNNDLAPYIAGDYKVTVTTNFSAVSIPDEYQALYEVPDAMSSESGPARWWTRATITSIDVAGPNMTIAGNNGGAIYTTVAANAITSIGFVAGDPLIENDYSMSKVAGAMSVASNGNATDRTAADLFNFTKVLTHDNDLKDLSGDYLDGLGFVDADNAPSALSIAVFNTTAIAEFGVQSQIGTQIEALVGLTTAAGNTAQELSEENIELERVEGLKNDADEAKDQADNALTAVNVDGLTLQEVSSAAATTSETANSDVTVKQDLYKEGSDIAIALASANTRITDANAEVTRLANSEYTVQNKSDHDAAVVEQTNANTDLNAEYGPLAAHNAAVAAHNEAIATANAATLAATAASLALTDATTDAYNAATALTTADTAVSDSEARKADDVAANDLAKGALQSALDAITLLGSDGLTVTTVEQAAIIAQARLAAETAALRLN